MDCAKYGVGEPGQDLKEIERYRRKYIFSHQPRSILPKQDILIGPACTVCLFVAITSRQRGMALELWILAKIVKAFPEPMTVLFVHVQEFDPAQKVILLLALPGNPPHDP
ncbi:MAG: hypothetical protein AW06_003859 [Candidatus Accumulibacter cognatus]|uniref:Uncharacterized protein n=1 Tax=Candidatus Accumulibacter cognatus TaxID=2954383 RepID=A0A080M1J2_9PROT|nr:MAG: hypothetical protein AW06_003859 [Candidatus Accumulibacter cognatus]